MADKIERIYTVPLGDCYHGVRSTRTKKAVTMLRTFVKKHMKAENEIIISNALNTFLWKGGMQKPPRKVKIRTIKEGDVVRAFLHDEKIEAPKPAPKKEEAKAEKKEEKPKEAPQEEKVEKPKETPKEAKPPVKEEKTAPKPPEKKESKPEQEKPAAGKE